MGTLLRTELRSHYFLFPAESMLCMSDGSGGVDDVQKLCKHFNTLPCVGAVVHKMVKAVCGGGLNKAR